MYTKNVEISILNIQQNFNVYFSKVIFQEEIPFDSIPYHKSAKFTYAYKLIKVYK